MKLILVRHGQTVANAKDVVQGVDENKLNKKGIEQAKSVGKELKKKYDINMVFCSPLVRSVETLEWILTEYPIEGDIFMCKLLEERNFGEYTGIKNDMVDWEEVNKDKKIDREMGLESLESLKKRAELFLEDLKLENEDSTVLVISHDGPIRMMISKLTGKTFDEIKVNNGEIVEFDYLVNS